MRIYLIRHGQTTGDVEDRYGGDYDDHPTPLGISQAQGLADKLHNKNIEKILASPLMRARETAQILSDKLKIDVEILPSMRERNHNGILSGMIRSEAKEKYPHEVERVKTYKTCATGGEEYDEFKKRITVAFVDFQNLPYENVAVVTHGGPIKLIFREILRLGEVRVEDCGYCVLETNNGILNIIMRDGVSDLNH